MARALAERVAVRSLIYLDRKSDGRNIQRSEGAISVIQVFRDRRVFQRRVGAGCPTSDAAGSGGRQDGHTACAADCLATEPLTRFGVSSSPAFSV